nr:immunoglobulin heavy chain junction region [Macaca mulatta]
CAGERRLLAFISLDYW